MSTFVQSNTDENDRFKSFSDFEDCMIRGGEVAFICNGKIYAIGHDENGICICEAYKEETERSYKTADETLEYVIDGVRLRDIITKVEVIERTI